ncbi:MAG: putative PurR-regulated permease PerM [Flavobacteriales bacterium]|jgi:predicted PurR-regulated permease PerM
MKLSEKTKTYLIGTASLVAILLLVLLTGEIILPFILALFVAYQINPVIVKMQRKIKNRNMAITSFLLGIAILIIGAVMFLGDHVVNDTKRFVTAVEVFADENKEQIQDTKKKVLGFADNFYQSDLVQNKIIAADTLANESSKKDLMTTLEGIYSFFETPDTKSKEPVTTSWNWFYMFITMLLYIVVMLYTYDYFEKKQRTYFPVNKLKGSKSLSIWQDFDRVFMNYFKQRTKIVLISMSIFLLAFSIIDLPGAIILGVLAGLLTFVAHFHYLSLPLVVIGSWVLSTERENPFFLFFGIVLAVYVLISILEETVFFDKIMKSVSGMNPAVIILAFAFWIYIFGGFTGTLIALPLTQLIMIYMDRLLIYSKEKSETM